MPYFPHSPVLRRACNFIFAVLLTALAAPAAQKIAQTITFPQIPDQFLGVSPFPITAHASSNLPVSFSSSTTPSVCTNSGAWVLPLTAGTCTIEASQAGNGGYLAATPVDVSFNVQKPLAAGTMGFGGQTAARGTNPNGVAVADFDHDGHMDAAITTTLNPSNLTIMFGGGSAIASTSPITLNGDILHAVATGDFNNDGKPDLVVAATNVDGVSFLVPLIGQGTGVLTPQTAIGLGSGTPTAIAVGDFNGDGNQDVAVAYANGRVATLTGDGLGNLTVLSSSAILLSQNITSIVSVDINHDGFMDLIFTIPSSDQVYIYTADSGGAFSLAAQPLLGTGTGPNALAVGDFNQDGNPDFAVTLGSKNQVAFFTSNASGSFAEVGIRATVGAAPMSIVAADFDGDGHQDLAIGDSGTSNDGVYFLLGDGAGNFSSAFSSPEYSTSSSGNIYLAVGDFNADQREDVLAVNGTAATLVVWTGALASTTTSLSTSVTSPIIQGTSVPLTATVTASGSYFVPLTGSVVFSDNQTPINTAPGGSPYQYTATSLSAGAHTLTASYSSTAGFDISSGGPLSITVLSPQTITFPTLSNQGYGDAPQRLSAYSDSGLPVTYSTTTSTVCTPVGGEVPHVNVLTPGSCTITASQGGDPTYAPAQDVTQSFTIGKGTQTITFSWPNGVQYVGKPFLAPASSDSGLSVTIVANSDSSLVCKASGSLILPIAPGLCHLTATQAGNALFNAALPADAYAGISVSIPSGKLTPDASTLPTGNIPTSAALADFDGDGSMDLAVVNHNDHSVSVFRQGEAGAFTSIGAPEMSAAPDAIVAGDFNGDGFPDVAVTSASSSNITVLLNDGEGNLSPLQGALTLTAAPGGIALGDFNNDGVTDLIVSEPSLGKVVILAGDGHGSFTAFANPITAGTAPGSIAVADFDGDGNQDIVVDDDASARAIVLRGDGAGGFTAVTVGGPFTAGASLAAVMVADFNNDGHADFAIASPSDHRVSVWLWNGVDGFIPSLGSPFLPPSGSGPLAAVDFDGDGHLDLAVADTAGTIQVLLGDGSGGFTPALNTFPAGNGINAIAAGNIDGDGTIGIAVVNAVGNTVTFLRGGQDTLTGSLTSNSAASVPYGTPIDLTLTLTPSTAAFRVPAGTTIFTDTDPILAASSEDTVSPFHATTDTTVLPNTYAITATYIGNSGQVFQSTPLTRTITQLSQSITFSTLSDQPFGTQSVNISGSASAPGGSIHFSSNSTNVCQVEGSLVSLLSVGSCTIQADQSGNSIYTAAASKTQSFNITAAPQTITFKAIPTKILGSAPFVVAAEADSHLPVTVTSTTTTSVCRTAGTLITLLATGTCTIDATQSGDANHSSATKSRSFSVIKSVVAGTMSAPAGTPISMGDFTQPFGVAVGDFNEDGVPDLATAGNQSGTVSVALGSLSGGSYSATLNHQYPVGSAPLSIVAADLNGDGHLDLVTPDQANGRLVILLGQGDGTFVPGQTPVTGAAPSAIAVADLNGDGIPDLVAANQSDNNIALLKNDGTGSFTATYLALGSSPTGIAIGDFNKDGKQDLAVTSYNGNGNILTVFAGVGDGSFTTPGTTLATGPSPQGVIVIDYDKDGNSDLAVANNDSTISLFKGDGLGGFSAAGTPIAINSAIAAVVAGDFNGDGFPDLAAPSIAGGSVSILLGDGQGHFTVKNAGTPPQAGWGLAEFDLNGDGFDDLAIANLNGNAVSILQGGLAATQSDLTTTSPLSIPGNSTVPLTVNVSSPNGAFVPPTGTVTFKEGTTVLGTSADSTSPYTFTTPQLAPGQHTITAYYGGGSGSDISNSLPLTFTALAPQTITFAPLSDRPMDPLPIQLTATADSGLTVSLASTTAEVCSVSKGLLTLLSTGQCSITATQPGDGTHDAATPVVRQFNISVAPQSIHFGTILHPTVGLPPFDIPVQASSLLPVTVTSLTTNVCRVSAMLLRAVSPGTCTLQASQPGNANYNPSPLLQSSFLIKSAAPSGYLASGGSIAIAGGSPVGVATGDFNNDGFSDLAVANPATSSISVLLGDASGALTPLSNTFPTSAAPLSLVAGDFNADGYSDVAVMTASDGSLTVLLGGPGGALTPAPGNPSVPGLNAYAMAVGDFNGDGIEDLATVNSAGGQLIILTGNGLGGFAPASQTDIGGTVIGVAVGDFDRDGKQDVAVVDIENNKAYLLLGNGNGGFVGSPVPLPVGGSPIDISVGDFDANGNPDLAIVNQADSTVTLLIGDGQGGFQPASSSPITTGLAPQTLVVGDFTGDGLPDIGAGAPGGLTLLKNGASLNFTQAVGGPFTLPLAFKAVIGDFNNDGRLDVAAMNATSDHIQILLGANAPTTSTLSLTSQPPILVGDTVQFSLTVANTGTLINPLSGTATLKEEGLLLDTAGQTTSPFTFSAAGFSAGAHTVTAHFTGAGGSADSDSSPVTFDIQQPQTISFGPLSDVALVASPLQISATASSGLQVSFSSGSPSICGVSGTTVTLSAPGQCTINADQAGDLNWAPATQVAVRFNVAATAQQTITFPVVPNQIFGVSPFVITAKSDSGLPVTLTSTTTNACRVAGTLVTILAANAGTCDIVATQAGNTSYDPASPKTRSFIILNAAPAGILAAVPGSPITTAGTAPEGVAAADLNHDGRIDFIVADNATDKVTVLLADGNGGYNATHFGTGHLPDGVTIADFDRDGNLDFAVVNTSGSVTVYRGDGAGLFTQLDGSPFLSSLSSPNRAVVGDFNGDSIPDLAISADAGFQFSILTGIGDGTFNQGATHSITAEAIPLAIAVGDFNRDNVQDLAIALSNGTVIVQNGDGAGGFTADTNGPFGVGTGPVAIVAGDFNNDGKTDLATANTTAGTVSILIGDGAGNFTTPAGLVSAGTSPSSLAAGDYNGDGFVDLVVAHKSSTTHDVGVLLNNGDGSFRTGPNFDVVTGTPDTVVAADFDNDGAIDLAVTNQSGGALTLFRGALNPTSTTLSTISLLTVGPGTQIPLDIAVSHTGVAEYELPHGAVTIFDNEQQIGSASQTLTPYTFLTPVLSAGSHAITAVYSGDQRSVNSTSDPLTVLVLTPQSITFLQPADAQLSADSVSVSATASSNLLVSFNTDTTPTVCSVSENAVKLLSAGTCTVTATQAGGGAYAAATPVSRSFQVSKSPQTITFAQPSDVQLSAGSISVSASASSNLLVAFNTDTTLAICQVANGVVKLSSAGTCTVTATQDGDNVYAAAPSVSRSFQVSKSPQTITFAPILPHFVGDSPFPIGAQTDSGLAVTLVSTSTSVCKLTGDLVAVVGVGTCTIQATQPGDGIFDAATSVTRSFVARNPLHSGAFTTSTTSYTTGHGPDAGPTAVAVADFDGDGLADFATANTKENSVTIMLANADGLGGFHQAPGSPYSILTGPIFLATGDFNGDAKQDIAVLKNDGSLALLLGTGEGVFNVGAPVTVGSSPQSIAVGDLNGDNIEDIVVAETGLDAVRILSGDGSGHFTSSLISANRLPYAVALGDYDGDGVPDIAVANNDGHVTILINRLTDGFNSDTFTTDSGSDTIVAADFNLDGYLDLAVGNAGTSTLTFLMNDKSGSFTSNPANSVSLPNFPESLSAGDFNGDGTPDLAIVTSAGVVTALGVGDGTFTTQVGGNFATDLSPTSGIGWDFNNDGYLDLLTVTQSNSQAHFQNGGPAIVDLTVSTTVGTTVANGTPVPLTATVTPHAPVFRTPSGSIIFFDADSPLGSALKSPYTLTANSLTPGSHSFYASYAGDSQTAPTTSGSINVTVQAALLSQSIAFGPLSDKTKGSGNVTLSATASSGLPVSFSTTSTACSVAENSVTLNDAGVCAITASQPGDSAYAPAPDVLQQFSISLPQTISFDAIPDEIFGASPFVVAAQASSQLPVTFTSLNLDVCKTASNLVTIVASGSCQITATQPGNSIYAAATPVTRSFEVNPAQPGGTFTQSTPIPAGTFALTSALGDFNGDHSPDIAVADSFVSGKVTVLLANGNGGFTSNGTVNTGAAPYGIAVGDFDVDGNLDLVTPDQGGNSATLLKGNGKGTFTASSISSGLSGPEAVAIGDFNGDGIQDIAATNGNSNNITVEFGVGDGTFSLDDSGPFATGAQPRSIVVGDFNGDGKQDLATANISGNNVTVLLGDGRGHFSPAPNSPYSVGTSPIHLVIGDFDHDGVADLAVANSGGTGSISVLKGSSDGSFTAFPGSPYGARKFESLAIGDFNGDGKLDIAAATYASSGTINVLLGDGAGGFSFSPTTWGIGQFPTGLIAADLNADGIADLIATNSGDGTVSVLFGAVPTQSPQTITFAPLSNVQIGAHVDLSATASSSLTVTFESSTTSICTVSGTSATAVAAGTCTIVASQSGNENFAPASASRSFEVTAPAPPQQNPQTISFGSPGTVTLGIQPFAISATASSGLPVTFTSGTPAICSVTENRVSVLTAGTCSITAIQNGNANFAAADPVTQTFTVQGAVTVTTSSLPNGAAGVSYSATLAAKGGNGGPYTWSAAPGSLPQGITLGSNGVLTGNPSAAGTFTFTVQASDGVSPAGSASLSITIFGQLSITTTSLPNGIVGSTYGPQSLSAKGGSGSFTWTASGLPGGVTLSAAGSLGGTPTAAGDSLVSFTATDTNTGQTLTAKIPLSVVPAGTTLQASPSNLTAGAGAGAAITGSFTASGGTPPYKFSTSGLPAGISLSGGGQLSGSTATAGTYTATVTVTDSATTPATTTAQLTIHIFGITSDSLNNGAATAFYTSALNAAGGTPPVVFSATGLPTGLSLSGAGALTGTVDAPGAVHFTVQAADSAGLTSSRVFTLTIGKAPVSAKALSLPDGTVGAPYSGSLKAAGGATPYSWSLISGALPAGLSLSSAGAVSGIPTAPGTTTIGVQVTDSTGGVASGGVSITVAPAPVTISTGALPTGVVNFYYGPQIIDITGGVAPYTFALSGSLPTGLSLTGNVISGTPAAAGTFPFTLNVTDSAGNKTDAQSSILIRPPVSDLVLLSGSVSFSLAQGTTVLPAAQSVGVQSTVIADSISYSASANPGANWLTVTGGGTTPGAVGIALSDAALSLPLGSNSATVTVTCTSSTCQGKSQTIAVSLNVSSPPAQLGVSDGLLSLNSVNTLSQPIQIQNIGGGVLNISSISCDAPWCSVGSFSPSLTGGAFTEVTIGASATGLASGFYRTAVNITSSGGSVSLPVTFLVTQDAIMVLAPSGTRFDMAVGGKPGNVNGSFVVAAAGGAINWSAAAKSDTPWLTLATGAGSSSGDRPGSINYSINSNAASLAIGAYYATIEVTSADASNSPQDYQIVLNVAPTTAPPHLTPNPSGLTFDASTTSQVITMYSTSSGPTAYQASASTTNGGNWLSVTPTGSASRDTPGTSTVTVKTAGLAGGVYTGSVSFAAGSSGISIVNVSLVIPASAPVSRAAPADSLTPRDSCSAANVVPTQVGLINSFSAPASWPTPLSVQLSDDCGNVINNGQVIATFSNGDPPLPFIMTNSAKGVYSGTWTPRNSTSRVTIKARGTKSGLVPATAQLSGAVVPNAAPAIDSNGVVHPYDPLIGGALSPGTIVAIYGSHLASQIAQPSNLPLPVKLNGTSVLIGGVESPLFYVSPSQINVQIPFELDASGQYQVVVSANGALTPPQPIQLTQANPGLDTFPDGSLVAVHASDGTLISATSPAQRGEYVVLFALGLGATDNPVTTGEGSSATVLSRVTVPPTITMNSNPVPISFAGLTPGFVGLYQVNLQIPDNQPGGNVVVKVSQGDTAGNSGILPIAY